MFLIIKASVCNFCKISIAKWNCKNNVCQTLPSSARQTAALGWTRSSNKQIHCYSTIMPQYLHGLGKSNFQWFTYNTVVSASSIAK